LCCHYVISFIFLENIPFENTKIYSWISRRVGFAGEDQLPHAGDGLAEDALFHLYSYLSEMAADVPSIKEVFGKQKFG